MKSFLPSWQPVLLIALSMTTAFAQQYVSNGGVLGDFSSLDDMPAQLIFHHVARCAGIELNFETCALNKYIDTHIATTQSFESQCQDLEAILGERVATVVTDVALATFECNEGAVTEDGIPDYTFDPVLINNVTLVLSNGQCWTELCFGDDDMFLQVEADWIEECADVQLPYPLASSDEIGFGLVAESEEDDALLTCMLDYVMESPPSEFDLTDPSVASENQCYPPGFQDMQTHCPNVIGPRAFNKCKYLLEESPYEMEMDMSMSMNYNHPTPNPSTNSNPHIDSYCGIMYDLSSDRGRKCLVPICDFEPTQEPSSAPSADGPTQSPTLFTAYPTTAPPSSAPSCAPSAEPSFSAHPSASPSAEPSFSSVPSASPTSAPSSEPSYTAFPSASPSVQPSVSVQPSDEPSFSAVPSETPSTEPSFSSTPSESPSAAPSASPSAAPSPVPTKAPTVSPTQSPTAAPTASPTRSPTASPTRSPTATPTASPTVPPTSPYPTRSGPADEIITVELTSTITLTVAVENVPQVGSAAFEAFKQALENAILNSVSNVEGDVTATIISINGVLVDDRRRNLRRLDETAETTEGLQVSFRLVAIRDCLVANCVAFSQRVVEEFEGALEDRETLTTNIREEANEANVEVLKSAEVETYELTGSSTTINEVVENPLPEVPETSSGTSCFVSSATIVLFSAICAFLL